MDFCYHPIRFILKAHEKSVKMNDMLTDPSFVPPSSCDASRCVSYSAGVGVYPAPKAVQDLAGQGGVEGVKNVNTPSHPVPGCNHRSNNNEASHHQHRSCTTNTMEMRALRGAAAQGSEVVRKRARAKIYENARMQNVRTALFSLSTTSTALMVAVDPRLREYGHRGGTMHSAGAVAVPMSVALSEPPRKAAAMLSHVASQIKPGNQKSLKLLLCTIIEQANTLGDALVVPAECQPPSPAAACSAAVLQAWGTDVVRTLQLGMPGLSDVLLQLGLQGRGRDAGELLDGVHAAQKAACRWNDQALWYMSRVPRAARPRCWAANRVFGYDERNSTACGVLARPVSVGDAHFDLILHSTEGGRPDFGAFDECNGFDTDSLADTVALVGGEEVLLACAGDALAGVGVVGCLVDDGADLEQLPRAGPRPKLERLKCPQLKALLSGRKLKVSGKKQALIDRLLQCAAAACPSRDPPLCRPTAAWHPPCAPSQPGSLAHPGTTWSISARRRRRPPAPSSP